MSIPGNGRVADPGFVATIPGNGAIICAPVSVCLSSDGGATFPQKILIEDGPGTCLSNDSTDGRNKEMSYPWLLAGPDGSLHIAYTYHRRAIKYVRLAPGWDRPENGE